MTGRANGVPIRIEADLELAELGPSRSVLDVNGWAEVKIPVAEGQIEKMVTKMVEDLLRRDRDAVEAFPKRDQPVFSINRCSHGRGEIRRGDGV